MLASKFFFPNENPLYLIGWYAYAGITLAMAYKAFSKFPFEVHEREQVWIKIGKTLLNLVLILVLTGLALFLIVVVVRFAGGDGSCRYDLYNPDFCNEG